MVAQKNPTGWLRALTQFSGTEQYYRYWLASPT